MQVSIFVSLVVFRKCSVPTFMLSSSLGLKTIQPQLACRNVHTHSHTHTLPKAGHNALPLRRGNISRTARDTDSKRHQFLTHTFTLYSRKITAW